MLVDHQVSCSKAASGSTGGTVVHLNSATDWYRVESGPRVKSGSCAVAMNASKTGVSGVSAARVVGDHNRCR